MFNVKWFAPLLLLMIVMFFSAGAAGKGGGKSAIKPSWSVKGRTPLKRPVVTVPKKITLAYLQPSHSSGAVFGKRDPYHPVAMSTVKRSLGAGLYVSAWSHAPVDIQYRIPLPTKHVSIECETSGT